MYTQNRFAYFKFLLNNSVGSQLLVIESRKQQEDKKWVDQKPANVKSKEVSVGQFSFEDYKKGHCKHHIGQKIEFHRKTGKTPVLKSNMNNDKRDKGIEQIPESHTQQQFSTTEYRYWRMKKIIFKIQDERVIKKHRFKGSHQDQSQEKQEDYRYAVFLIHSQLFCSGERKT
jgi:hypothetical protein